MVVSGKVLLLYGKWIPGWFYTVVSFDSFSDSGATQSTCGDGFSDSDASPVQYTCRCDNAIQKKPTKRVSQDSK